MANAQEPDPARIAVALIVAGIVAGSLWYGFSSDVKQRIWQDLTDRPGGPMTFRFILQPVMAALVATLYPGEAVIVALLLAFVPYLLLRGPFARFAKWWRTRNSG